jgi:hypothetical protein
MNHSMTIDGRARWALRFSPAALALGLSACGGPSAGASAPDAGIVPGPVDAGVGEIVVDAGVCSTRDAACPGDAMVDAAVEASIVVDVGSCVAGGPIAVAGDYTAADGTGYWLRKSFTASTYTVVPAGAPAPSVVPQVFRIESVCSRSLLLENTDGASGRLDWATMGGSLGICVRMAPDAGAATALPPPDPGAPSTGCAGAAWTVLTKVTP